MNNTTNRNKTDDELNKKEDQFRAIFESSKDCILVWDKDYNYLYANQAAIDHVGTTRDKVIGKTIREGLGHIPDFMKLWMRRVDKIFETGKPLRVEDAVMVGDRLVYSESMLSPIRDAAGKMFAVGVVYRDVTERKKVELMCLESEARYHSFLEYLPEVVYSVSAKDETITFLNLAFEKITGWSRDEWTGKAFLSLIHPDDLPIAFKTYQQTLGGKTPPPYELRIRTKSGEYVVGEFTSSPQIEDGKIIGEFGIVRDITERKKTESALRETKERLEYILAATKTNVDVIDSDFNLRYVDPAWIKTYGEPAGRKCYEYFMGRDSVCPTCGIPKALKTKKLVVTEEILPRENNRVIEVHTIPFQNPEGDWLVAEFNIDITRRKKAEEALRQSEEQHRLTTEHVPIHIAAIDKSGKFIFWNKYSEVMFGYSQKEAVGKLSPYDVHETKDEANEVVRIAAKKGICDKELNLKRKDGRLFPARLVIVPYKNPAGEIVSFYGFAEDITERKKIDQMKENLIRDVTHELKTPIAMTEMAYDMCVRAIKTKDMRRIKKAHNVALRNIQRFRKDVENVLKVFALGHEKVSAKETCSLKKIVQKAVRDIDYLIKDNKLKIKIDIPKNADAVFANKNDVSTLITNIIDNAVKFTKRGGITISSRSSGNRIIIKAVDTGAGIAPAAAGLVFEKFYKQSTSLPGVGLGLPICKEIVERYNGKINVSSKGVGKGTTVIVTLPRHGGKK